MKFSKWDVVYLRKNSVRPKCIYIFKVTPWEVTTKY